MNHAYEVWVCQNRSCLAQGSAAVLAAFQSQLAPTDRGVAIGCECQGQCNMSATVRVVTDETWYCRVKPEDITTIIQSHLLQGQPVEALLHPRFHPKL
jgi:(2Fe-2S) ferredoxin